MACSQIGAIHRAARVRCTRLFRPPFAAALEGTRKSKSKRRRESAVSHGIDGVAIRRTLHAVLLRQGLPRSSLFPGPSRPRRAGGGLVATAIAGRMPASSTSVHGRAVGEPRSLLA